MPCLPERPTLPPLALLGLLLTVPSAGAAGQVPVGEALSFRALTIEDGLSQNAVSSLVQDHRGFVWIGTKDGLNRYDGYEFLVFRHDPFDDATIPDSKVTALFEDEHDRLWIGTRDGGLSRLDRHRKTFVRYPEGPRHPITSIQGRGLDELWIGTDGGGLVRYDIGRDTFTSFRNDPEDPTSLSRDRVLALLVDRGGFVWAGTPAGLDRLGEGGRFRRYTRGHAADGGLIDSTVSALHEDPEGRLWVGSVPGVTELDPDRETVRHHAHRYRTGRYGWGLARALLTDREGQLWLSTAAELMLLDPRGDGYSYHRQDPLRDGGINSNQPTALLQDRSGVIWVGTNGAGVNLHDPKSKRFRTFRGVPDPASRLTQFSVYEIFEDARGAVWIGAGVLYRWDRDRGTLESFETVSERPDDFGNHAVWSILEAPVGTLWVASDRGLYRYELDTGRSRQYRYDDDDPEGLPEQPVRALHLDRRGSLWLATENYLVRSLDLDAGRFRSYRFTDPATSTGWTFPSIREDSGERLWIGTHQGLVAFDPDTETFRRWTRRAADPRSLSHDVVLSVAADPQRPDDVLWLGTAGGGLARFDIRQGSFSHYTVRHGLPNNVVYGILPDTDGRLWLSTNRGLARFDPGTGAVRTFDDADGLQSNEFNSGAYYRSPSGELFFGGIRGLTSFYPDQVRDNPFPPPVVITAFARANRPETVRDSGTILPVAVSEARHLRVPDRDKVVSFEFTALDFSAPEKNRFAYRLLGFDSTWVDAGPSRSATYTNLPPGEFTLEVRASNNDGIWNPTGAALGLTVVPPWWKTGWAYSVYVLLALATLYALRRFELDRARLRTRLELERTEGEKLRELDQARSRFFNDVSHEFRTPLTLTLGPLDDLLHDVHGPIEGEVREQVSLAHRSATRVLELIDQIMDLARAEAGRLTLQREPLDLADFVLATSARFQPLARRKTITLEHSAPHSGVAALADRRLLEKALDNLLSNALKYTPPGGTVRVSADARAGHVWLSVRDSGPGIPAGERERIFERFQRGKEARARDTGTGIGLALANEIVQLHGGRIDLESDEGFGSTFTIVLPAQADRLPAPLPAVR